MTRRQKIFLSILRIIGIFGNFLLMMVFWVDLMTLYLGGFPPIINREVNYVLIVWVGSISSTVSFYYLLAVEFIGYIKN